MRTSGANWSGLLSLSRAQSALVAMRRSKTRADTRRAIKFGRIKSNRISSTFERKRFRDNHFKRQSFQDIVSTQTMKNVPRSMVSQTLFVGWMLTAVAMGQGDSAQLERVLARMDETARAFRSAQATLTSDQYQKVINETETQKGKIYFRREAGGIQMAIDFDEPDKKYIVYSGGKIQMYQPKIDQVNEYIVGKNRGDI